MKLRTLELSNFRNIEKAHLSADEGLTVIAGANGQGKTNLLESIYLLCGGKSFRGSKDKELVRHGCPSAFVSADVAAFGRDKNIKLTVEGEDSSRKGRFADINGVDYGRAGAIAGNFTAVVFDPGHLHLVKGGPDARRRFLDVALCQLYPGYVGILRRYTRALTQKNAILKRYYETNEADALLDTFDEQLSQVGNEITRRRAEYLDKAAPMAEKFYEEISLGAETLKIEFMPSAPMNELLDALFNSRKKDIRAGFSTLGPHREDFDMILKGKSARTFASQGQQRSAVLSLKLAEAQMARHITGEHPVLLLDDVLSELDENRQKYLLCKMEEKQSFVTCCEPAAFKRTAGKVVFVEDGIVQ